MTSRVKRTTTIRTMGVMENLGTTLTTWGARRILIMKLVRMSQEDSMEKIVRDGSPEDNDQNQYDVRPIAAFHPKLGVVDVHKSNSTTHDRRENPGRVPELGDKMESELGLKK
jgi:hypothetical protein